MIMNIIQTTVNNSIQGLTTNPDHQQDLWIYYLDGNSPDTFEQHLRLLTIKDLVSDSSKHNNSIQLMQHLSEMEIFTSFELSIIFLYAIGLNMTDITQYSGISRIRIIQMISALQNNDRWNKWLSKHNLQMLKHMA